MLRSAIVSVRSAALQPEHFRQLNYVQLSRLFGPQLRSCSAQSSPNTSSSKHDASAEQKTAETDTKTAESTKEAKESEHDRLLKEKEGLIKDLQVCQGHSFGDGKLKFFMITHQY